MLDCHGLPALELQVTRQVSVWSSSQLSAGQELDLMPSRREQAGGSARLNSETCLQRPKTKQDGSSASVGGRRWEYGLGGPECPRGGCPRRTPVAIRTREGVWHEQERAGPRNGREGSERRERASRPDYISEQVTTTTVKPWFWTLGEGERVCDLETSPGAPGTERCSLISISTELLSRRGRDQGLRDPTV